MASLIEAADVCNIRLRKDCLVAVLERKVVLYAFDTLRKFAAYDSYDNAFGVCAVSTDLNSLILSVPTLVQGKRSVQIYRYL